MKTQSEWLTEKQGFSVMITVTDSETACPPVLRER